MISKQMFRILGVCTTKGVAAFTKDISINYQEILLNKKDTKFINPNGFFSFGICPSNN